jgi:hypothetical protein
MQLEAISARREFFKNFNAQFDNDQDTSDLMQLSEQTVDAGPVSHAYYGKAK